MDSDYAAGSGVQGTGRLIPAAAEAQATKNVMPDVTETQDTEI